MTIRAQVRTGLLWTAGARLLSQVFTWAITIIVIRLLNPGDYGLLAMATVFTAFLLLMAELGLGPAIVQAPDIEEVGLQRVFGAVLLMNGILLLLLYFAAPFIAAFFDESRLTPIVRVLALQFVPIAFSVIPNALLQRKLDFRRQSLIAFLSAVVSSVLTLVLAFAGLGVWALVWGSVAASFCTAIALNIVSPFKRWPRVSLRGTRSLMVFGGNVTASRLLWFFYSQADVLIAGRILGKELLGYYSLSMHLASMPVQKISSIINEVAFPAFSRVQGNRDVVVSNVLKAFRVLCFVGFPFFFGISSIAPEVVVLLLGPQWTSAIFPLQVLALIMPLRLISNFLPSASDAIGRPDVSVKNLAWACLIMPIAFFIGSYWGLVGMTLAWAFAFPIVFLSNVTRALGALGLPVSAFLRVAAVPAVSSVCMYAMVAAARTLTLQTYSVGKLVALIAVGVSTYAALVYAFNRQGAREVAGMLRA
jgi:O-antigen/teichoic acid export membrane protein